MPKPRTGQAPPMLDRVEFGKRFRIAFYDPAFHSEQEAIARLEEIAWNNYKDDHKAPLTVKAGAGFADPDYDLSVEWLDDGGPIECTYRSLARRSRVPKPLSVHYREPETHRERPWHGPVRTSHHDSDHRSA